jgi:hypothetical protein
MEDGCPKAVISLLTDYAMSSASAIPNNIPKENL